MWYVRKMALILALAALPQVAKGMGPDALIMVCLSGRGDKDLRSVQRYLEARGAPARAGAPAQTS